ncbi:N-methyl-L-tryptophan oxidase [Ornithinibacillus sp. L9]|uniref:N-methyl-L-tryptophan oxidase n=1 Tax=Ornithinibacillus caprae TaxID=2678566 RepID=A0A6N8FDE0_9BACI|nr:N-methyl-L-tryptophan oxidase [Ornithinibacillus caprae]MUK87682.1 N-methyl-L-tryptophan oxidase [Ornithinibacillus caprae]
MGKFYDVAIIGAGSMGMAAGYFLAKQGKSTLLLDANDPPHANGSHHGSTRIIRHAYGEGRQYVSLVLRAQELWEALEKDSGNRIFEKTGVLGIGDEDSAFIKETIESAHQYKLPLEVLSANEVKKRWPGIQVPNHFVGCFEPNSGFLYSEECIRSYRKLALNHGADLKVNTKVEQVNSVDGKVEIITNHNETFYAQKVVVSAGAWASKLLATMDLPLQPTRKTFAWFDTKSDSFDHPKFPAFFFDIGERLYYGFPNIDDAGLKLGRHDGGQDTDPDEVNRVFGSLASDEGDLREFLDEFMPQASGKINYGKVCLYTKTTDDHFILDHHPKNPNIIIAAGFSGHGFKFSSVIGEILSQLAMEGKTEHDISLFRLGRFNK